MESAYMQSLSSIYQSDSIVDAAITAALLIEWAVIEKIEVESS
jgi:hypothetical protein